MATARKPYSKPTMTQIPLSRELALSLRSEALRSTSPDNVEKLHVMADAIDEILDRRARPPQNDAVDQLKKRRA
jgi:hypothetical protein